MRIGIDARELVGQVTGVGRYLDGLLAEWTSSGATSRHHFVLYAPSALPQQHSTFDVRVLPGTRGTWWQQTTLAAAVRRDTLDAFFAPQYTSPLLIKTPTVVVIYDVSFGAHPEWFRTREGIRLRTLARLSAAAAREIVTISEFSGREIAEHLHVDRRRIHVIPPGIPRREPISPTSPPSPRVLYVGSIFNRRHVLDLIRSFAEVARAHADASLDLVGDNRSYPFEDITSAIAREQLGDRIRWHRYASDGQLADLFGRARAFAFFSEYEGLGMTPLEALAAGVPPVLYDTSVARESCGDAALYVPFSDQRAAVRAMEALLYDDATRARVLRPKETTLAKYSWPRAANETLSVIERCR
jgi:glycosyltransferase involved in cell wall biosynthesis